MGGSGMRLNALRHGTRGLSETLPSREGVVWSVPVRLALRFRGRRLVAFTVSAPACLRSLRCAGRAFRRTHFSRPGDAATHAG
jgi:hypothetical protein